MTPLLNSKQALEVLNIKNRKVIGWLVQRNLLPRVEYGPNTFRYDAEDLESLKQRVKPEGIQLTQKP